MKTTNGKSFLKTISNEYPNSITIEVTQYLLLFIFGMFAASLHAYIRIPMGIPGHNGLIFMTIVVFGRTFINKPLSGLASCLGASTLMYLNVLGIKDPFIFVPYLVIGVMLDLFGTISIKEKYRFLLVAITAGVAFTCIPIYRHIIASIGLFQYGSLLKFGLPITILSHFAFAFSGGLLGYFTSKKINKG